MKTRELTAKLVGLAMVFVAMAAFGTAASAAAATGSRLTPDVINDENLNGTIVPKMKGAAVLRAQVLLERAHFSPGEFDASFGDNMRTAVIGYQKSNHLRPTGTVDERTWAALNRDHEPVLVEYEILKTDVKGDFEKIPKDMEDKADMDALGFTSPAEGLGERFHVRPDVLRLLNPGKNLNRKNTVIVVPNLEPVEPLPPVAKIVVDQSDSTVSLLDAEGRKIAQYPASTGSEHDPLPFGNWEVVVVANNPTFHYNPGLFWDASSHDEKETIPAGPNNPVGVVWIDLSKEHYGIHGTPEPSNIGKTQSHGCIRMTNWSALEVSQAVSPGTPVIMQK